MMQASNWIRRAAIALRKTGWAAVCGAAIALLPVATPPAQAKKPAKTAKAAKASAKPKAAKVAKAAPGKQAARASGKSRTAAKSKVAKATARTTTKASRRVAVASSGKADRTVRYVRTRGGAELVAAAPGMIPVVARGDEAAPTRIPVGDQLGLRDTSDPLQLQASVALVMDGDTNEVLLNKNDQAVLPIASLTKLMTGLLISEAKLPTDELITITSDDVDTEKHSRSRLAVGTTLTRGELLHLALMSSENRAAHALGRTYPGGLSRFVPLMNARAAALGMKDTRYVEPTGLSSDNRSSASDLAKLVAVTAQDPLLRQLTTSSGYEIAVGRRTLQYNNSNRLVKNPQWDVILQKTGYISEAGQCLVMQTRIAGRKLIMVFLDSFNRIADAERVRRWVEAHLKDGIHVGDAARSTAVRNAG